MSDHNYFPIYKTSAPNPPIAGVKFNQDWFPKHGMGMPTLPSYFAVGFPLSISFWDHRLHRKVGVDWFRVRDGWIWHLWLGPAVGLLIRSTFSSCRPTATFQVYDYVVACIGLQSATSRLAWTPCSALRCQTSLTVTTSTTTRCTSRLSVHPKKIYK